jgi:hypothetical protein
MGITFSKVTLPTSGSRCNRKMAIVAPTAFQTRNPQVLNDEIAALALFPLLSAFYPKFLETRKC